VLHRSPGSASLWVGNSSAQGAAAAAIAPKPGPSILMFANGRNCCAEALIKEAMGLKISFKCGQLVI